MNNSTRGSNGNGDDPPGTLARYAGDPDDDDFSTRVPRRGRGDERKWHHKPVAHHGPNFDLDEIVDPDGSRVFILNGEYPFSAACYAEMRAFFLQSRTGPEAEVTNEICELLKIAYRIKDTWLAKVLDDRLKELGYRNNKSIDKARRELGIDSMPVYKRGGGLDYWVWTTDRDFDWRAYRDAQEEAEDV